MLATLCDFNERKEDKIRCVYEYFRRVRSYNISKALNSPHYTLANHSDCKNAVAFYCSVFRKMNVTCRPTYTTNHTYAVLDTELGYCNLDQNVLDCYLLS